MKIHEFKPRNNFIRYPSSKTTWFELKHFDVLGDFEKHTQEKNKSLYLLIPCIFLPNQKDIKHEISGCLALPEAAIKYFIGVWELTKNSNEKMSVQYCEGRYVFKNEGYENNIFS